MYARLTTGMVIMAMATALSGCFAPGVRSGGPVSHNLPPAQMLAEPGPGVGGPGPGVIPAAYNAPGGAGGAMMQDGGFGCGPAGPGGQGNVQVLFDKPDAMYIHWDVSGMGNYDSTPLVVPGRQNFAQGGIYRLKLTNVAGREGIELYPTLEIGPMTPRTSAYLAHAAIPIQFTEEDFDQVMAGNFVTKVIFVPDPEFQELALAGLNILVSTRLDPGVDPIVEADRRGSIMAIIRLGNKDLEVPGIEGGQVVGGGGAIQAGAAAAGGSSGYISGVTGPTYGMPITGTSIGLPGPPHIPLGGPAGLRRYDIHNHTAMQIPGPTPRVNVHVKQVPGLTYPRPADKVLIREHTMRPSHINNQPPADMVHGNIPLDCPGGCGGRGCNECQ